jgi:hypothetical protein
LTVRFALRFGDVSSLRLSELSFPSIEIMDELLFSSIVPLLFFSFVVSVAFFSIQNPC